MVIKRVAVIGAGLTGTLTALCLADAGVHVDLYDRKASALLGASGENEGKIHLGYVYAMDQSLKTAKTMLRGAARFRTILERWVSSAVFEQHVSDPFLYGVPRSSMLDLDKIRAHFRHVSQLTQELGPQGMVARNASVRELTSVELESTFDPKHVAAGFETDEIAVDPLAVRLELLSALTASPKISARFLSEVRAIGEKGHGYVVHGKCGDTLISEHYDAVVNAAWQQRLKLDATLGIEASRKAIHRYKCGLRTTSRRVTSELPSVTFIVGEYGDCVAYGNTAFVSWYPTGLLSQETGLSPERDDVQLGAAQRSDMVQSTLHNLEKLLPGASGALLDTSAEWEVVGGYISAWGHSGIDRADSELHDRYDVGVHTSGGYHSIDTGKYTLAPLFAAEVAARILA